MKKREAEAIISVVARAPGYIGPGECLLGRTGGRRAGQRR